MRTVLALAAATLWAVLAQPVASDIACPVSYAPLPPPRPAPAPVLHKAPIIVSIGGADASVDVLLGKKKVRMLIDTGANSMNVTPSIAKALIASGAAVDSGGEWTAVLGDGSRQSIQHITIKTVTVGDCILFDVGATVSPTENGMLLIGFVALNHIGRFTIDTQTKQLIFG